MSNKQRLRLAHELGLTGEIIDYEMDGEPTIALRVDNIADLLREHSTFYAEREPESAEDEDVASYDEPMEWSTDYGPLSTRAENIITSIVNTARGCPTIGLSAELSWLAEDLIVELERTRDKD